jgi:membrane protein implicated in regulation of membrane protease activity
VEAWVVWLVVAAGLAVAEVLTLTLVLGMLGAGALVGALAALLGAPLVGQAVAFAVASAAFVVVVRPVARKHLTGAPRLASGTDALVGRSAVVTEEVAPDRGRVRLGGEDWRARPLDGAHTYALSSSVVVSHVDGATLVVYDPEHP